MVFSVGAPVSFVTRQNDEVTVNKCLVDGPIKNAFDYTLSPQSEENRIKELGLTYTFLRPNLYMQGLIAFRDHIKTGGRFYASIGSAAISAVDIRDIAAVAAIALTERGHENKTYTITGPEALTHDQMAAVFSKILGKQITFIDITPEQMEGALGTAGFPEWQVGGLLEDYAHYARGEAATVYSTVNDVTNIPATSFEQFVEDYKMLFS